MLISNENLIFFNILKAVKYLFILFFAIPITFAYSANYNYQLAAALIFKDEAPYLKEWIEYHKLVGVQYFYLYNNESTDDFKEVLRPYILRGEVELCDWSGARWNISNVNNASWNAIQCLAYVDAVSKAKRAKVKWIAIIDADEFLVPTFDENLVTLLTRYEGARIGGVAVPWVMFGTSHVPEIPKNQLLIETLILNGGWNCIGGKSIFRPECVNLDCSQGPRIGPHNPEYLRGWISEPLDYSLIQCNHYWSRDEFFFYNIKIPRRAIWSTSQETCQEWMEQFNQSTPASEVILRFIPELRKRMGFE